MARVFQETISKDINDWAGREFNVREPGNFVDSLMYDILSNKKHGEQALGRLALSLLNSCIERGIVVGEIGISCGHRPSTIKIDTNDFIDVNIAEPSKASDYMDEQDGFSPKDRATLYVHSEKSKLLDGRHYTADFKVSK
jgi:hypothetical protein